MLKLLLCSALLAPCFIMSFSASSVESRGVTYNKISFDEAYLEPELDRLDNCQSAELDVFFHENYITTHSAEYIAEGIELSNTCENARYVITPIVPASSQIDASDILNIQSDELSLVLKAHGITPVIAEPHVQTEFNSLSANGRTATLKIVIGEGDSA